MYETVEELADVVSAIEQNYDDLEKGDSLTVSLQDSVTVEAERPKIGQTVTISVRIHEKFVQSFSFEKSGGHYTRLSDLGIEPSCAESTLQDAFKLAEFDFAEVESQSMSGGHDDGLADRVFTYEALAHEANIRE